MVESLEPRVLYSADAAALLGPFYVDDSYSINNSLSTTDFLRADNNVLDDEAQLISEQSSTRVLVFVDTRIDDYQEIVNELGKNSAVEVVVVESTESGLSVVSETLATGGNVSALHVLSHSDGSGVRLGSDWITSDSLESNKDIYKRWVGLLTEGADILLYGCNLAATSDGLVFMQKLAALTGADVTASSDQSGSEALDANWTLEVATGSIDSRTVLSQEFINSRDLTLASLTVSTFADILDGDTSSISTLLADPGADSKISLREAVYAANNTAGADEIILAAGTYALTIPYTGIDDYAASGDLDIAEDLSITGASQDATVIDASLMANRHFEILGSATSTPTLNLNNLTLANGVTDTGVGGGAVRVVDAILNVERVSFENNSSTSSQGGAVRLENSSFSAVESTFEGNKARGNGGALSADGSSTTEIKLSSFTDNESTISDGGAISSTGDLIIADSEFRFNKAFDDGGAVSISSGSATSTIKTSTFEGNEALGGGGGGVINRGTSLFDGVYFKDNTSANDGGGLLNNRHATIQNSTFDSNKSLNTSAGRGGGGVAVGLSGTAVISYSTFFNNSAHEGGGLHITDGTVDVSNSTFSQNVATEQGGAIGSKSAGNYTFSNSIFEGNLGSVALGIVDKNGSEGFNLFDGAMGVAASTGDIEHGTVNLGVLQDNGGPVPTMALLDFSDGIDAGQGVTVDDATGIASNEFVDIGAFEYRKSVESLKVYWISENDKAIYRANESGDASHTVWGVQKIVDTADTPQDLEFNSVDGKLYWVESDGEGGRVMRADADGQNAVELLTGNRSANLLAPGGLAIDEENQLLYVASDANLLNNPAGDVTDKILEYNIEAGGLTSSSTAWVFEGTQDDTDTPMDRVNDLEYVLEPISGARALAWADYFLSGARAPSYFMYGLSTSDYFSLSITSPSAGPPDSQGVAYNPSNSQFIVSDYSYGLASFDIDVESASATPVVLPTWAGASATIADIDVDPQSNTIWYVSQPGDDTNGSISIVSDDLTTSTTVLSSINTPMSLAFARSSAVNVAPTWSNLGSISLDEGEVLPITDALFELSDDTTADHDLVFSVTSQPAFGHIALATAPAAAISSFTQDDIKNSRIVYVHDGSENDSDVVELTASDGHFTLTPEQIHINVNLLNENSPVLIEGELSIAEGGNASTVISAGTLYGSFLPLASDIDSGDSLSFAVASQASSGSVAVNTNGMFVYTHDGSETFTDSFKVRVTDANFNSSIATYTVAITPVNDNSPAAQKDSINLDEGGSSTVLVGGASSLLDNDTDVDFPNDTLTAQLPSVSSTVTAVAVQAQHGDVVVNPDGTFLYEHDGSENFNDSFDYQVIDADGKSSLASVDVVISPVFENSPNVQDDVITLDEGTATSVFDSGRDGLLDGLVDADVGDTATITTLQDTQFGTLQFEINGAFIYTHDGSENFEDEFVYQVSDSVGNRTAVTIKIHITPLNDNDPIGQDDNLIVAEGDTQSVLVSGALSLLENDTDADLPNDSLTAQLPSASALSMQAQHGTVSINVDGTFSYQHDGSENLTDSFDYQVMDADGKSSIATVNVNVTAVNDTAPVVPNDVITLDEGASSSVFDSGRVSLLQNLTDADGGDSASIELNVLPLFGTVVVDGAAGFLYTHDGSENHLDKFIYRVIDEAGNRTTVDIEIRVNPVNDNAPTLPHDTLTVLEGGIGTSFDSGRTNLLAGAIDLDIADSVKLLSIEQPLHGQLSVNADGTFDYLHSGSELTSDVFSYVVEDISGNKATKTVAITILPVNDAPSGTNAYLNTNEDVPLTLQLSDFGFNDLAEDNALQAVRFNSVALSGSLSLAGQNLLAGSSVTAQDIESGLLVYSPAANQFGEMFDTITFQVIDDGGIALGGTNTDPVEKELSFSVNAINDDPVVSGVYREFNAVVDEAWSGNVESTVFYDEDGDFLVLAVRQSDGAELPSWLSFDVLTGTLSGTPSATDTGRVSLTVFADDQQGGTLASTSLNLIVRDTNDAPTAISPVELVVAENLSGVSLGTLNVADRDVWDTHTFDVDDQRFDVIGNELWLKEGQALDFESEPEVVLQITATDTAEQSVVESLIVNTLDINEAPVINSELTRFSGSAPFTLILADDYFVDAEGDLLTYDVGMVNGLQLPSWLKFTPDIRELQITENAPPLSILELQVSAQDDGGQIGRSNFQLEVLPAAASALPDLQDLDTESFQISGTPAPTPPVTLRPIAGAEPAAAQASTEAQNPQQKKTSLPYNDKTLDSVVRTVSVLDIIRDDDNFRSVSSAAWENSTGTADDPLFAQLAANELSYELAEFRTIELPLGELFNPLDSTVSIKSYASLSRELDQTREELSEQKIDVARAVQTSVTVSTGVSVGYIVWLLRSSALIGSVLSSLPAWRSVDPLPILSSMGALDNDSDDDSESLESLVGEESPISAEKGDAEPKKSLSGWMLLRGLGSAGG